jgi:adenylate kinase
MNIIMLGAPGSGKGTQAAYMCEAHHFAHISTGDLLRAEIKAQTPLGQHVQAITERGALVDDGIVIDLIKKTIETQGSKSLLFDGFPRTLAQAESLAGVLQAYNRQVDLALYMEISEDAVVKRIVNRYTCEGCGAIYNNLLKPLNDATQCDHCGGGLFKRRSDDNEEVVRNRFAIYQNEIADLLTYYGKQEGVLKRINADQDQKVIETIMNNTISERLGRN